MSILNHFRPTAIVGLLINSINCAKIANAVKNRDWGAVEKLVICFLGIVSKYRK